MIGFLIFGLALGGAPQSAPDPVHDIVQKVLNEVWDGADFTQGPFKGAVTPETATYLHALKPCDVDSVSRTEGDKMAIIHWHCVDEGKVGLPSTMLTFEAGKVTKIEMAPFVSPRVKGE